VRSAEVLLLARTGRDAQALALGRKALDDGIFDYDLSNAVFVIASGAHDFGLADRAMQVRLTAWPETRVSGYMQLGAMYSREANDPEKALAAYGRVMALADEAQRRKLWPEIPQTLRNRLDSSPPTESAK